MYNNLYYITSILLFIKKLISAFLIVEQLMQLQFVGAVGYFCKVRACLALFYFILFFEERS